MPLYGPPTSTATVGAGTNTIAIAGMDLTVVTTGMTISIGSRVRKTGDEFVIAGVSPNGTNGGSITTADASLPTFAANSPFLIDTCGFLGTDQSYAAATSLALLATLATLLGPSTNLYSGSRQLQFDKLTSTALSRIIFSTAGRSWGDLSHRALTYTPAGGSAVTGEFAALRAFPDGTNPVDALAIDLATGGGDLRMASATMAAATTVDLGSAPFAKVGLTGSAAITSLGAGKHLSRWVHVVDGGATLSHNATSLSLPGKANIVTAAGDTFHATSDGSGNWRVRSYTRADGTPLVLPPSTQRAAFRNRIRNGDFSVNQRSVSGTVTLAAGQYGHDGFKGGANGCTYTFARANGLTTLTISAGSLVQAIEGALSLTEGGTYTLSWGGTAPARVNSTSSAFVASPIVANGLTPDFNAVVEWSTGTLWQPQFEPGAVATSFERRDDELRRCQRYFERIGGDPSGRVSLTLLAFFSSTQLTGVLPLVPKRVIPTVLISAANQWRLLGNGGAPSPSALSVSAIGLTRAEIYVTASGLSAGAYVLQSVDNPSGGQPYLDFSAEL